MTVTYFFAWWLRGGFFTWHLWCLNSARHPPPPCPHPNLGNWEDAPLPGERASVGGIKLKILRWAITLDYLDGLMSSQGSL